MLSRTDLDFISIVEHHPQKEHLNAELQKLDERLFLDPEFDPDFAMIVWTVKYALGAGQQPLLISDWRDPDTRRPLELSWGLFSRIKARENRDPFTLRDEIKKENERTRTLRAERQQAEYEELVRDMVPRIKGTRSAGLHRGQHLRRSRDRLRALGYSV